MVMTRLEVTGEVAQAFPGLRITAVVVSEFDGHRPWPEVDAQLTALEASAARESGGDPEDDPHIAAWHTAYRAFGTNPRRQRPSVSALRRRLPRISSPPPIPPSAPWRPVQGA